MIDLIIFGYRLRLERFRSMKLSPLPTNLCAMTGAGEKTETQETVEIVVKTVGERVEISAPLLHSLAMPSPDFEQ